MKSKQFLILPLVLSAFPLLAQENGTPPAAVAEPAAETDPAVIKSDSSYGFGYNSGMSFKQQMSRFGLSNDDIDRERFIKGFMSALEGNESESSQEKINASMLGLRNMVQEREKIVAAENLEKGNAFLAENKKREGVKTTDSGLQYEVLVPGGEEKYDNTEGAQFLVNYRGTLIDGTEFDASPEGSPVPVDLNRVPGFREALTAMPVGAKWKIFLKPDLAFGEQRRSDLLAPNSTLIFELELVEIQKPAPRPKAVSPPIQIPPIKK